MAKNNSKKSSDEELAKQQEEINNKQAEIAKKAEERAKKRAAEISERNKINAQQKAAAEQSENDIPDPSTSNEQKSNFSSEEQSSSNLNSNEETFGEQTVENVDDSNNDIPTDVLEEMDIPEEIVSELEEITEINPTEDSQINDDGFDPLKEKVIKRVYTDGNLGANKDASQQSGGTVNSEGTTVPPVEPVIAEPIINVTPPSTDADDINAGSSTGASKVSSSPKPPPINPKLDDLTAAQKRKAAEKTADALVTTYANLIPIPFKKLSSFSMRKLERRHINDEIDMNMIIMEDGTRVRDYCEKVNEEAESIFVVTKEMQDEIREPLIDVLLENNFALTPTQRLVMAIGGQIVQMGISTIQLMSNNSSAMNEFKKFHEENKASKIQESNPVNQEPIQHKEPVREESRTQTSSIKNDIPDEEVKKESKPVSNITNSDIPDDKETVVGDKVTLEDFLTDDDNK